MIKQIHSEHDSDFITKTFPFCHRDHGKGKLNVVGNYVLSFSYQMLWYQYNNSGAIIQ